MEPLRRTHWKVLSRIRLSELPRVRRTKGRHIRWESGHSLGWSGVRAAISPANAGAHLLLQRPPGLNRDVLGIVIGGEEGDARNRLACQL